MPTELNLDDLRAKHEAAVKHLASPDLYADDYGLMVWGKSLKGGDSHVFDVRGWGELTGRGHGALALSDEEGKAAQHARQAYLVAAWNAVPALLDQIAALKEQAGAFEWFGAKTNHELSYSYAEDDECWTVHRVNGGINDREWTCIGKGLTPAEAILNARQTDSGGA